MVLGRKCKPIFVQIAKQVIDMMPQDLRLPSRAWKVKLVGEGADDAGGVFDDTITEMCQEITTGLVPLLVQTPNALNDEGFNRDKYLLNPDLISSQHLSWYKFLGIVFFLPFTTCHISHFSRYIIRSSNSNQKTISPSTSLNDLETYCW